MRSGSSTLLSGLGASCDAARDAWLNLHGREKAAKNCAAGWRGKHGCDRNFPAWCSHWGYAWGKPTEVPASSYPDYVAADRKIQQFISQIQSCQTTQRDIPASWKLAAPDGKAPADVVAAYNSYSLRRYQELPEAIADAGVFCSPGSVSGGSGSTDPMATNPSAGGGWSASFENGNPYGEETAYADIYTPTGATGGSQVSSGSNYGSVVANPYAPPPPAAPAPRSRRGVYIGGGAALVAVVALVAMRGRRKSKRRGSR